MSTILMIVGVLLVVAVVLLANRTTKGSSMRWLRAVVFAALALLGVLLIGTKAAHAADTPVLIFDAPNGATILLHEHERGPCVGEARLAVWLAPGGGSMVPGCYRAIGIMVYLSWLDGDTTELPTAAFRKASPS